MSRGDRGKDFEAMMAHLLRATSSHLRRVFDARSFREVARFAPAVHCDYEAILTPPPALEGAMGDIHIYLEMKASKDPRKFPFKALIKGQVRKGRSGDADSDWSKFSQFDFCRLVHMHASSDQYWYMIGNRYTPRGYYAILLDWPDIAHWLHWLETRGKASVPWELLKERAIDRADGLDRLLYQAATGDGDGDSRGDPTGMGRFVTTKNIAKIQRVFGVQEWGGVVNWGGDGSTGP